MVSSAPRVRRHGGQGSIHAAHCTTRGNRARLDVSCPEMLLMPYSRRSAAPPVQWSICTPFKWAAGGSLDGPDRNTSDADALPR